MSQQHLDGSEVGAGFQQMGGKAVAQGMRMDAPVLQGRRVAAARSTGSPKTLVVTG